MVEESWRYFDENPSGKSKENELSREDFNLALSWELKKYYENIDNLTNLSQKQKEQLKKDVKLFLFMSLRDFLSESVEIDGRIKNSIWEFNISSSDTDREEWLDSYELNKYMLKLEEALKLIIELWWLSKFQEEMWNLYLNTNSSFTMNMDLFWDKYDKTPIAKSFSEWYLKNISKIYLLLKYTI